MKREVFDLVDDYCEHDNNKEDCDVPCSGCDHDCSMHEGLACSGPVMHAGVDLECDCEEFED